MYICILPCTLFDVFTMIAVFRELYCILALEDLEVSCFQRKSEFFNLVAGIVDVELAGYIVTTSIHSCCQTVADCTAASITHVHWAGWVCGYKLNHNLFALAVIGTTVVFFCCQYAGNDISKPQRAYKEVDKTRTSNFHAVDVACSGKIHLFFEDVCNLNRSIAEGSCRNHCCVGSKISVCCLCRNLYGKVWNFCFWELSVLHCLCECIFEEVLYLMHCVLYKICIHVDFLSFLWLTGKSSL